MKLLVLFFFTLLSLEVGAQKIVNLVFVGDKGETPNPKEATFFIVVKEFGTRLQRLDYKMRGPLVKERNYIDSNLQILDGTYYEYDSEGALSISGRYLNNLKDDEWRSYNDTGKVTLIETYLNGILIKTADPDTIQKKEISTEKKEGEKEAEYGKNGAIWKKYLQKNLRAEVAAESVKGGSVRIGFTVDTPGKCVDIYVRKSVEFVLDEEVKRIIAASPLWTPAEQDGKKVKAFRIQPITFVKD